MNAWGARSDTPPLMVWRDAVEKELEADLGHVGDITTDAVVSAELRGEACLRVRTAGCLAGMPVALYAFHCLDQAAAFSVRFDDGSRVEPGDILATVRCSARALLSAERTALNFLGHLSGIASVTRSLVDAVEMAGTQTSVVCTRKTTPITSWVRGTKPMASASR